MYLMNKLLKLAGKENFQLDSKISSGYILNVCWKYGWMMIRGKIFAIANKNISKDIFVGRHVKVLEKKCLKVGSKSKIHDNVWIDALSQDGVKLGDNTMLGRGTRIECTGSLERIGKGLTIGARTTFGNDCFFGAAGGIVVGNDVIAGQYIRFHSENHNYEDCDELIRNQGVTHKGIVVGNNCWIGSGAVFLDGAQIGSGCVIASNAVVTKRFGDNLVIGGVPAKIISRRE